MIVYLDQNKWIQLAQIINGKNKSKSAIETLNEIKASIECGYIYPLSAIHYLEFSRISNSGRRKRLGQVMWDISKNKSLASSEDIVIYEIEVALSKYFPKIKPRNLELIGTGVLHAFGQDEQSELPWLSQYIDKSLLTGAEALDIDPISFFCEKYRKNFQSHLSSLNEKKHQLENSKWENWLYAIALKDISSPLTKVMINNGIHPDQLNDFSADEYTDIVNSMPSRALDVHLHRQVLKNPNYKAKMSDLEDWAGLGLAACYCDVVVCEKHFADMLRRDKFKTSARVVTNLNEIFEKVI